MADGNEKPKRRLRPGKREEKPKAKKALWKSIAKIIALCTIFAIALIVALTGFGFIQGFDALPTLVTIGVPLVIAWLIAAGIGQNLVSTRSSLALATVCLLVAAPVAWYGPWKDTTDGGDGVQPGDNVQENMPGYEGVLVRYEASFTYMSSDDNGSIESDLFLIFPCPVIDNKPALTDDNLTWQLWGPVNSWYELEVDGGNVIQLVGERTSFSSGLSYFNWIDNTSHGPKIWLQFSPGPHENSLYRGEKALVRAEFAVPPENENRVTLVDNWGGVYAWYSGWTQDNVVTIEGSFKVELSRKIDSNYETISSFSITKDNINRYAWVELYPI